MDPETEQAAARDREELAPRVAAYWRALHAAGVPQHVASGLIVGYQQTLLVMMEQGKDPDDELDLPEPP